MSHKATILLISCCLVILACKKESRQTGNENTGFQEKTISEATIDQQDKNLYYRFPSAREMLGYIKTEDLHYRTNITNPTNNISNYHSSKAKTLNLGVYLADLSYMILFEKNQQTDPYFNAIFNLTNDLRIKVPDEEDLAEKISKNMYNTDSLVEIADRYYTKIIHYLLETGQEKRLAVISTGSYIEGLYISLHLITDYNNNQIAINKIADQKYAFKNLANFAQGFKEDINTEYSLEYLDEINTFFEKLPVIRDSTKVRRTENNKLVIEGGEKIEITPAQFEELKQKITKIRTEIIRNKMIEE